ncbi:MAG: hypothetical protein EU535_03595 [Promethearchaeota archaeon]|nr:MAG: hypothetical protein EU535_03595 [Candidatus Lokiarchaeota archaeon]
MDIFHLKLRSSKRYRSILFSLIFLIFLISLLQNLTPIYAKDSDDKDESLTQSKTFQSIGTEVSNLTGKILNDDSINIDLLTSNWNITDINLEFLELKVKLDKEDKIKDVKIKDINLSLYIDNNQYKIEDLQFKLKKNFKPNAKIFTIPFNTNISTDEKLILSIDYAITVQDSIDSEGNVYIKEDSVNFWTINLPLMRYSDYALLEIKIPKNWYNLRVYRNGNEITSEVLIIENFVTLSNETILNNSIWLITAYSPNLEFSIDLSDDDIEPDQKLKVSIQPPIQNGQLTSVLIDPSGEEESSKTKDVISEETTFSYTFELDSSEGEWKIVIFWSNDVDAGVESDKIEFIKPPLFDQQLQLIVFMVILIGAICSITYFSALKIKNATEERKQKILDRCQDLLNLDYITVMENKSGLKVYEQTFPGKPFDVISFSEFLDYLQSFGIEVIEEKKEMWTIKIDFKNYKVILTDFKQFKTIFVMNEVPSNEFLESIKDLTLNIQNEYSKYLTAFDGHIKPFEGIKELLEHHLQIYFLYPLKINKLDVAKLTREEESLIILAQDLMKQYNLDHFYIKYLFPENNYSSNDIKSILHLIDKEIFQPLYLD